MAEALLLSVIHKVDINYGKNTEKEEYMKEEMERVIKEMREIVDIVRDKELEEGRSLNFLVSDLVDVAEDALHLLKQDGYFRMYDSIHSWIGEIKKRMLKLGDDGAEMESNINMTSSENDEDVVGLDEDLEMLLRKRIIGGEE